MSQGDPTDHALAAIASILDQPQSLRPPEKPLPAEQPPTETKSEIEEPPHSKEISAEAATPTARPAEANGYFRTGPGPMSALRFKWTVREENGDYYVDETIGETSSAIVLGPMSGDAAIDLVNDREARARRRFENLKGQMAGGGGAKSGSAS